MCTEVLKFKWDVYAAHRACIHVEKNIFHKPAFFKIKGVQIFCVACLFYYFFKVFDSYFFEMFLMIFI